MKNTGSIGNILKKLSWGGIIAIVIVLLGLYTTAKYNNFIALDADVKAAWAQVENQYQRRIDLVPNLVATVKGAAAHEKDTLEAVVSARASATKMDINLQSAEEMAEFQSKQTGLSSALGRLLMITENYPNLQANQNFLALMTQLEGTENRISVERKRYNEMVRDYNKAVGYAPGNIVAKIFGFEKYQEFKSIKGAEVAPSVAF